MQRIYLDYASTTPVDPVVSKAMSPYFSGKFGNAGSVHSFGQEAIAAVDASREMIAKSIGAKFSEIVFTGSATEANNLILRGIVSIANSVIPGLTRDPGSTDKRIKEDLYSGFRLGGLNDKRAEIPLRIIISAIEHESVLATAKSLEKEGVEVIVIPVHKNGVVDLKKLEAALNEHTVLVSVMYANNEVGTIQPISEIAKIIQNFRNSSKFNILSSKLKTALPFFHTDVAQAFQYLNCNVDELGVDFMTLSAHKIYGPKGIGALYINSELQMPNAKLRNSKFSIQNSAFIISQVTGGGQELGLRSGTENVPYIVGFAKAIEIAAKIRGKESERIAKLRQNLWDGIKKIYPKAEINGTDPLSRLPNNLNIYLPGVDSQFFLTKLDLAGVAASSGSACSARALTPSYVVEALGYSKERAKQSVRFTLGKYTTKAEIDKVIKIVYNAK